MRAGAAVHSGGAQGFGGILATVPFAFGGGLAALRPVALVRTPANLKAWGSGGAVVAVCHWPPGSRWGDGRADRGPCGQGCPLLGGEGSLARDLPQPRARNLSCVRSGPLGTSAGSHIALVTSLCLF